MQVDLTTLDNTAHDPRFLPLGSALKNFRELHRNENYLSKLNGTTSTVEEIWGTLGWADDRPFILGGQISLSEKGNNDSGRNWLTTNSTTKQEMELITQVSPEVNKTSQVKERYIDFSNADFDSLLPDEFTMEEIPMLRLTLFLKDNEGAIVYYQHGEIGKEMDGDGTAVEYILSDSADAGRDRLTYKFNIEPKHLIEYDEATQKFRKTSVLTNQSFIIKVLTFCQEPLGETALFQKQIDYVNRPALLDSRANYYLNISSTPNVLGNKKYALLLFDGSSTPDSPGGHFIPIDHADQVDRSARTLLLIHGTFVNTAKSFADLLIYDPNENSSELQRLLSSGEFVQIIAFDHPTVSDSPDQNVDWLLAKLQESDIHLDQKLSVITTSRGALVIECMAARKELQEYIPDIGDVLLFSAGNGCGYLRLLHKIGTVLKIVEVVFPGLDVITMLAQRGVQWLESQPGLAAMNPDGNELAEILSRPSVYPHIRYKSIISDWDRSLKDPFFMRFILTLSDKLIQHALGPQHDYVIGCDNQGRIPGGQNTNVEHRVSLHGKYLKKEYVRDRNYQLMADPQQVIMDYFGGNLLT